MEAKSRCSTCIICQEPFMPHPKVGLRQKACRKLSCQLERKRHNQKAWIASEPDYFKGRYPQLKEQILSRRKKGTSVPKQALQKPFDSIQDELTTNNNILLRLFDKAICIQDELKLLITIIKQEVPSPLQMVYKSS